MIYPFQKLSGLSFALILFCLSVHAGTLNKPFMIGKNLRVAKPEEYPSVCKIQVSSFDEYGNSGLCTGVLVGSNTINTDGHCFIRNREPVNHTIKTSCGGIEMGKNITITGLPDPADNRFWWGPPGKSMPRPLFDFAILTLPHPLANSASIKANGPSEYFDTTGNLLAGVNCKMLGFGNTDVNGSIFDPYGDEQNSTLIEADLKDDLVFYSSRDRFIRLLPAGINPPPYGTPTPSPNSEPLFLASSATSGDSGGPLLCKAPQKSAYEVLGLILMVGWGPGSSAAHPNSNLIRPLWL